MGVEGAHKHDGPVAFEGVWGGGGGVEMSSFCGKKSLMSSAVLVWAWGVKSWESNQPQII